MPRKDGSPQPTSRQAENDTRTVSRPELLSKGTDAEFRRMVHAFFAFLARHERVRAGHARVINLAGREYTVLISIGNLSAQGETVSVNRLASHLHLSGAFITTVINRLVKMGLVHKVVDPDDKRRVILTLTEDARARLLRLAPVQRQVNDVQFGSLQTGDMSKLIHLLEGLIESSDKALKLQEYLLSELGDETGS